MDKTKHPHLHQALFKDLPKKRGRKKQSAESSEDPTPEEILTENVNNLGPILNRARTVPGNYTATLRNDFTFTFNMCDWLSSEDDNFITFYKQTAKQWEVMDVSVDDISYLSMSISHETQ